MQCLKEKEKKYKLYLFYKDYETSYTTYINHARWHRCLRSDILRVGGNRSARKETHLSDLVTTSHADAGYRTWVAAVRALTLCQPVMQCVCMVHSLFL